jgi:hypothetical protein
MIIATPALEVTPPRYCEIPGYSSVLSTPIVRNPLATIVSRADALLPDVSNGSSALFSPRPRHVRLSCETVNADAAGRAANLGSRAASQRHAPTPTDIRDAPVSAIYAVFPGNRLMSMKVRTFVDHLPDALGARPIGRTAFEEEARF